MIPQDYDLILFKAAVHTLANSVLAPLVALQDDDALDCILGYLRVYLAQGSSMGVMTGQDAVEHFILHAQRVGLIDYTFLDASFSSQIRQQVPQSPPEFVGTLTVASGGSGIVNASCNIGASSDRYELQMYDAGSWDVIANGVIGETQVDFQATGIELGTYNFRVVPRLGFFAGFPSDEEEFEVI